MFLPVKKAGFFLLYFLVSIVGLSQYKFREIRHRQDTDLVFPVFYNANKTAAKNINEFLQMDFFDTTIYRTPERKLFDDSRFISGSQSGYTSISYEIEMNNSRILSVLFEIEGMGAYPTFFRRYFSFDNKSGKPLIADTLFTDEGVKKIREMLIEKRDREIKQRIQELREELGPNFAEDSTFIAESFSKCNSDAGENNLFITREKILFYKEDCFPHVVLSYNTNLDVEFTYKEIIQYLSPFGKKLLLTK